MLRIKTAAKIQIETFIEVVECKVQCIYSTKVEQDLYFPY